LQAYALQEVLRNMGHEAILIKRDFTYDFPLWKALYIFAKRFLLKYILRMKNAVDVFDELRRKKQSLFISQNTLPFINKHIRKKNISWVKRNNKAFGAIVVGSDQIWRPKYNRWGIDIEQTYLSFAEKWNIKRIAYAASFGTDQWEYTDRQTDNCKNLVKKFDAVSVREKSGVDLCKKYFGINALHVLDPTMMLDTSHYLELIENEKVEKNIGNMFVYVLDKNESTIKIEQEIKSICGYTPFYSRIDNEESTLEERIATKPEVWLRSFYDAEFIFTDSFHGCVFSILFQKPFLVYGNQDRGLSRFDSLLGLFELEHRLITPKTVNLEQILNTSINWNRVNKILQEQREISHQFLKNSLGVAK
jgi:hypothetical protein